MRLLRKQVHAWRQLVVDGGPAKVAALTRIREARRKVCGVIHRRLMSGAIGSAEAVEAVFRMWRNSPNDQVRRNCAMTLANLFTTTSMERDDVLDLLAHRDDWTLGQDPFGEEDGPIVMVKAIRPDVTLIHAPLADRHGNVWIGVRREMMLMAHAAKTTLVTAEKIHDGDLLADEQLAPGTIPGLYIGGVAEAEPARAEGGADHLEALEDAVLVGVHGKDAVGGGTGEVGEGAEELTDQRGRDVLGVREREAERLGVEAPHG